MKRKKIRCRLYIQKIPPDGFHIFVRGKVGTVKVNFLIDTGASKSLLDKTFATEHFKEMHVIVTEHQTTGLGANYMNSEFAKFETIMIGKLKLQPAELALLDLSVINSAYQDAGLKPVFAIIGGDILKKYGAVINFNEKYIELA